MTMSVKSHSEHKDALRIDIENRITDAFQIFDHESNNMVECRDIGPIVRSLGSYPSEAELESIISEVEDIESSNFISFDKFLPIMTRILEEGRYAPSTYDQLHHAFQLLDTNQQGYLMWDEIKDILQQSGERFGDSEAEELYTAFVNPVTKRVDYCDWITWMVSED